MKVYIYPAKMTFLGNNLFLNISGSDCCNKTVSRAYRFSGNGKQTFDVLPKTAACTLALLVVVIWKNCFTVPCLSLYNGHIISFL